MYSDDGVTWTAGTAGTNYEDNNWLGVCWSPELSLFVAVAASGTHRVITSSDGITWTGRTAASAELWFDVAWSPQLGIFAAVAFGGSTNLAMTSPDGINWTSRTTVDRTWRGIDWSPELGLFAAVCSSGTGQRVMTSPDGATWTQRTTPSDNNWAHVVWSPDLYCFISGAESGSTDRVMISFDGLTWSARTTLNENVTRVLWSPQLRQVALVGGATVNRIKTSKLPVPVYQLKIPSIANLVYAASTAIDFNGADFRTISLTGDITFTTSNLGVGKTTTLKILADASLRNFTFPAGWVFVGSAAPASIAANKTAILSLTSFGATDAGVIAAYAVQP